MRVCVCTCIYVVFGNAGLILSTVSLGFPISQSQHSFNGVSLARRILAWGILALQKESHTYTHSSHVFIAERSLTYSNVR